MNCNGLQLSGNSPAKGIQDTTLEKQLIYNGKIWRNLYIRVKGEPFFLTGEFLNADVIFNGKQFRDLRIKFDIFNDEVILFVNPTIIIILNKEMINEFNFSYENRLYRIVNMGIDSTRVLNGFVSVLYNGATPLFAKYLKKIELQPYDRQNDVFYQLHRIYIKIDSVIVQISGKRELFKILQDRQSEIRDYVRANRVKITRKDPYTFIPLLQFFDSKNR